jgi:DNA adenine methylase
MSKPLYPPIKYPGGKRQLVPGIRQRFPDDISLLCEPFFGGGSLGLRLAGEGRLRKLVTGEACGPVRAFWEQLLNNESGLFLSASDLVVEFDKNPVQAFEWTRNRLNMRRDYPHMQAAQFLALNQTCNNGIVRFNSAGEFNVPVGKRQDGSFHRFKPDFEHLDRCRRALRGANFQILPGWEDALCAERDWHGWSIYADPPYTGGFVGYTPEGWTSDDDIKLYEALLIRAHRGARVVLSQPDTEWARDCCSSLLKGWQVDRVEVGRPANSDGKGRGPVGELLIWNKPAERSIVDMKPPLVRENPAESAIVAIMSLDECNLV